MPRRALVLAGGDAVDASTIADLVAPDCGADVVIAADSGLHLAGPLGLRVDRIVGDFDSAEREQVDAAVANGAVLERHPAAKDATDLELALDAAASAGATHVVVVGGGGGRIDHFLANALLLAAPAWADLDIEARFGAGRGTVGARRPRRTRDQRRSRQPRDAAPGRRSGVPHRHRRARVPVARRDVAAGDVAEVSAT